MNPVSPSLREHADEQLQAQLLRLLEYAERQQRQLDFLVEGAEEQGAQLGALVEALTAVNSSSADERLAELLTRVEASLEQQAELSQQIAKLTRTQFKANSLSETQGERLAQSLVTLKELASRREALQQARQEEAERQRSELRAAGRTSLAAELLPALDGLEAALASADSLQERWAAPEPAPKGFLRRFRRVKIETSALALRELSAWLQGLRLVHERFVRLLEGEGIIPIDPLGEPFDPHAHVAVEAMSSEAPAGTVLQVSRKGYRQAGRVLRYAEVVVARAHDEAYAPTGMDG